MDEIKLTKAQTRVLDVIQQSIRDEGRPPTRAEIANALGFRSINAAESHLRALERRGAMKLQSGASRGIQCLISLDDQASQEIGLPIIGKVAAGAPIDSLAHQEKIVPVDPAIFSKTPDYLLRVHGDSMIKIGIFDGDLLAVCKVYTARHGDVVVARINGEVTVKRLERGNQKVRLIPENDDYSPIDIEEEEDFFIEGHAIGVIRTAI